MHLERKTGEGINHEVIVILSAEVRQDTQNNMGFSPILWKGKKGLKG